jgi:hypothetical protein
MMRVVSSAKLVDAQVTYLVWWKRSGYPFELILDHCVLFKNDFQFLHLGLNMQR